MLLWLGLGQPWRRIRLGWPLRYEASNHITNARLSEMKSSAARCLFVVCLLAPVVADLLPD
jgi:hypothetical protein